MPPPPTGIPADPVLAEHGLEQAAELGAHIKKISDAGPRPVQQIYCSPYYRCLQTATPTSKALDVKVYIDYGASEWLNRPHYDHSPIPASTKDLAQKYFPDNLIDDTYTPIISEAHLQESYEQLLDRAKLFFKELVQRLDTEEPEVDHILIVTHAATKIALGRAIVGDDNLDIRTGTCSLDTFVRDPKDSNTWVAEKIGDTSFLTNGEEMHWSFGKNCLRLFFNFVNHFFLLTFYFPYI